MLEPTKIFCPCSLRDAWPKPLARQWYKHYPEIFDEHDLRLTRKAPSRHFNEWFAAIHLFHSHGVFSLIEKYTFGKHERKCSELERSLGRQRARALKHICDEFHVQAPDLYAYHPGSTPYGFVEVKGPGDRLSEQQIGSHGAISRELRLPVGILTVARVRSE